MEPHSGINALKEPADASLRVFEKASPALLGLAYRMLGSVAEAEDVVQDCYLRWVKTDKSVVRNPQGWLMTCCSRLCLDALRSAHRKRVDYVGSWLPEPVYSDSNDNPEASALMASSLTTAFLLMMERLKPKERAAYLLHDIFDRGYSEIAQALDVQEATCRKLVSRARAYVAEPDIRYQPDKAAQEKLLAAFQQAITSGEMEALTGMLADEAALMADSDGKVAAIRGVLQGKDKVLRFVKRVLLPACSNEKQETAPINNAIGLKVYAGEQLASVYSFTYNHKGQITAICIMRNPDKLANLGKRRMK